MNGRFEGIIQKVNKPKFINKPSVWSISIKENGKWNSVWRKDQSKADEEALSKPTLSRVVNYYIQQQRDTWRERILPRRGTADPQSEEMLAQIIQEIPSDRDGLILKPTPPSGVTYSTKTMTANGP